MKLKVNRCSWEKMAKQEIADDMLESVKLQADIANTKGIRFKNILLKNTTI